VCLYHVELLYEYHGIDFSYDVNGKYLFVTLDFLDAAGSSTDGTIFYIIDTVLKKVVPEEALFVDSFDLTFDRLIIQYLLRQEYFDMIEQNSLSESLDNFDFEVFYDKNGVGLRWRDTVL
jgi:hypothetical protein